MLLKAAPTPSDAARLTRPHIAAALRRAGRQRGIEAGTERLREIFRSEWAHHPTLVERTMGQQMLALPVPLEAACTAVNDLAQAVENAFLLHEDAEIGRPPPCASAMVKTLAHLGHSALPKRWEIPSASPTSPSRTATSCIHRPTPESCSSGVGRPGLQVPVQEDAELGDRIGAVGQELVTAVVSCGALHAIQQLRDAVHVRLPVVHPCPVHHPGIEPSYELPVELAPAASPSGTLVALTHGVARCLR
ncbi:hypothetical protein M8Z33_02035 [Streptomyces sp. ZAF1911]|uniref:hypothetical protein n=1 Tax=Streptomyces sp. ZAF1911 TaxID=2944129 RepID=UPI00237B9294|nr:hypothetical protein [Streptomyces sp. ZAF1911]MDD9375468.1 hypothetical protein [Streptomyces sp. ZAF1911]